MFGETGNESTSNTSLCYGSMCLCLSYEAEGEPASPRHLLTMRISGKSDNTVTGESDTFVMCEAAIGQHSYEGNVVFNPALMERMKR